ncbi:hypothetical protein PI124_g19936 [Phytophthora idaei]|nr:hypothetical protein PI124_g19936 [Phytophthora idaei]
MMIHPDTGAHDCQARETAFDFGLGGMALMASQMTLCAIPARGSLPKTQSIPTLEGVCQSLKSSSSRPRPIKKAPSLKLLTLSRNAATVVFLSRFQERRELVEKWGHWRRVCLQAKTISVLSEEIQKNRPEHLQRIARRFRNVKSTRTTTRKMPRPAWR